MKKNAAIVIATIIALIFVPMVVSCRVQKETTVNDSDNDSVTSMQTTSLSENDDRKNTEPSSETVAENNAPKDLKIDAADPTKGEYFVYAILKSVNKQNNAIEVEQIINEPNEKEIQPTVILENSYQVVRIILDMATETETFYEIGISDIKLNSEIGIIFNSDNTARAVIFQETQQ